MSVRGGTHTQPAAPGRHQAAAFSGYGSFQSLGHDGAGACWRKHPDHAGERALVAAEAKRDRRQVRNLMLVAKAALR